MTRASALLPLLPVLAYALACDAVGGPLVDDVPSGGDPLAIGCSKPPECEEPGQVAVPARRLLAVDLEQCRREREVECVPPMDAGAPDEAAEELDASAEELEPDKAVPCGPPPTKECELVVVESTGGERPAAARFSQPVWSGVEVVARSEQPFEVVLEDGWLFDLSITLEGPITLRIRTPELARNVRVRTADDTAGEARLVIEDSVAAQLSAGEPGRRFAGSIDVVRSELREMQLIAGGLQLESGKLLTGLVEVDHLTGIDVELDDLELRFDDALIAAFRLRRTWITRCGALTLIEGIARDTQFPACEWQPTRIYSAGIVGGTFDGSAEADRGRFTSVVLGLRSPTEIIAFNGSLMSVALCEHANALVFAAVSSIHCSSCPDGVPDVADPPPSGSTDTPQREPPDRAGRPPELVCFVPSPSDDPNETPTGSNFCELPPIPPVCDEPHPVRRRPLPEAF